MTTIGEGKTPFGTHGKPIQENNFGHIKDTHINKCFMDTNINFDKF